VYPDDIANILGWWDASDIPTVSVSGGGNPTPGVSDKVTEIADKIGSNDYVAPVSAVEPAWTDVAASGAIKDGKGTLRFDLTGEDKYMRANPVPPAYDTVNMTVIGVIDINGANGDWWHYLSQQTNEEGAKFIRSAFGSSQSASVIDASGMERGASRSGSGKRWVAAQWEDIGGGDLEMTIHLSGGVATRTIPLVTVGPSDIMTIGAGINYPSYTVDRFFKGRMGEWAVYDRVLPPSEIGDLARYLAHFWDVTE